MVDLREDVVANGAVLRLHGIEVASPAGLIRADEVDEAALDRTSDGTGRKLLM